MIYNTVKAYYEKVKKFKRKDPTALSDDEALLDARSVTTRPGAKDANTTKDEKEIPLDEQLEAINLGNE